MKIQRFSDQMCTSCGPGAIVLKISDVIVSKDFLPLLISNGFIEAKNFTKMGFLYVESPQLIAMGPFGSDKITVKCKVKDCQPFINQFEELLYQIG